MRIRSAAQDLWRNFGYSDGADSPNKVDKAFTNGVCIACSFCLRAASVG